MFKPTPAIRKLIVNRRIMSAHIYRDGIVLHEERIIKLGKDAYTTAHVYHRFYCDIVLSVRGGTRQPLKGFCYGCEVIAHGLQSACDVQNGSDNLRAAGIDMRAIAITDADGITVYHDYVNGTTRQAMHIEEAKEGNTSVDHYRIDYADTMIDYNKPSRD